MRVASATAASVKAASVSALNTKFGVYQLKKLYTKAIEAKPELADELGDQYVLIFPDTENVEAAVADYQQDSNVESASPNLIFKAFVTNPDDPRFVAGDQYGLDNAQAPLAWDRTTGSSAITVAVLDTGCNYNHEDLAGRVDLANAYDFVNGDADPMDDHGSVHGTGVCGVIGAATNNGKGIAGMDWQCQILPIKVLDHNGDGTMADILDGIAWARAKNANVINMSFGQYSSAASLQTACQDAYGDGIVLVAAAGNGNVDWPTYPAYYSTVLAVGAVNSSDQRSLWSGIDPITGKTQASNYGTAVDPWVEVCAAGTGVWSTYKNVNEYHQNNGTSFASPYVAGLASLVRAANPSFTNQQIMDKITSEADVVTTDHPIGKRINAYLAVAGVVARIDSPTSGAYSSGSIGVIGSASGWDFLNYRLEALQGTTLVATIETSMISVESSTLGTWDTTGLNGEYTLHLSVSSTGGSTEETTVTFFVDNLTPEATITSPANNDTVTGSLTIVGTAEDQYLDNYVLEYGAGASPTSYQTIKLSYASATAGALGTWETAGLDGQYTIRLTVTDRVGRAVVRTVLVTLQNGGSITKEVEPQAGLPITYSLPNPFDRSSASSVTLNYNLSGNFNCKIYIFDLSGSLVWQQSYAAGDDGGKAGDNNPTWAGVDSSGRRVNNGVYLYQVIADQKPLATGKIIILN